MAGVTVRDSAGIEIVENAAPSRPSVAVAEVDLTIGVADGDPAYAFGDLVDVAVDRRDRFLVLDQQAYELKIFDRYGRLVVAAGGPGEGPGEFSDGVASLAVGSGDSIYVADYFRRINVFAPDGESVRSIAMPPQVVIGLSVLDDRTLLGRALNYYLSPGGSFETFDGLVRISSSDGSIDTLLTFDYQHPDFGTPASMRSPVLVGVAFWDRLVDGSVAWAALDRDRVFVQQLSGSVTRIVTFSGWNMRRVTEHERSELVEYVNRGARASGREPRPIAPSMVFPVHLPAITAIRADPDGGFWVQRMGQLAQAEPMGLHTETGWLGGPLWDVFDLQGRYRGTVRVPPRFRLTRVIAGGAVGIQKDEMDVERVARLRVEY